MKKKANDYCERANQCLTSDKCISAQLLKLINQEVLLALQSCVEVECMSIEIKPNGKDVVIKIEANCTNKKQSFVLP